MHSRHLSEISLIRASSGEWGEEERERGERHGGRERDRVTARRMKRDSVWNRVLIVSKQGRCVGPGEEEAGVGWGGNGVRPSQAELSWGLMDENERDKDTKRGSSSVTKEHTSAVRPFQTNSHPSVSPVHQFLKRPYSRPPRL